MACSVEQVRQFEQRCRDLQSCARYGFKAAITAVGQDELGGDAVEDLDLLKLIAHRVSVIQLVGAAFGFGLMRLFHWWAKSREVTSL